MHDQKGLKLNKDSSREVNVIVVLGHHSKEVEGDEEEEELPTSLACKALCNLAHSEF